VPSAQWKQKVAAEESVFFSFYYLSIFTWILEFFGVFCIILTTHGRYCEKMKILHGQYNHLALTNEVLSNDIPLNNR
jgi:hypothetical protein